MPSGACARTSPSARSARQAHAELAGIPALLDLAVVTGASDEEPLPPAIEERLLDRFAREREPEPPRGAAGARGSRSAIPSALAGRGRRGRGADLRLQLPEERAAPADAVPARADADRPGATTPAPAPACAPRPRAPSSACGSRTCRASPATSTRSSATRKGWSASAGTFRVDAKGNGYVILTTAVKRGQYDRIRIVRRAHQRRRQGLRLRHPRRQALVNRLNDARRGGVSPGMRRIAVLCGIAALAFAACGGDDEPAATPAPTEAATEAPTEAATEAPTEARGGGATLTIAADRAARRRSPRPS